MPNIFKHVNFIILIIRFTRIKSYEEDPDKVKMPQINKFDKVFVINTSKLLLYSDKTLAAVNPYLTLPIKYIYREVELDTRRIY